MSRGLHAALLWVAVSCSGATADTFTRIADISPGPGSGGASNLTVLDDVLYFTANNLPHGSNTELWKYDGQAVALAAEINPDPNEGSWISDITAYNDRLYFSADNGTGPSRLYQFDGVSASPAPGYAGYQTPQDLVVFGDNLFFRATSFGTYGTELWKFNGAGQSVIDLVSGPGHSGPKEFVEYNGDLYFNAVNQELWRLNATATGATQVTDIANGNGSSPEWPAVFNGDLYFSAYDHVNGRELWRYNNGTPVMVADIVPGGQYDSGNPSGLTAYGGELIFAADDGVHGNELWHFDGTTARMLADVNPTPPLDPGADPVHHSWPSDFFEFDGKLYFTADDGTHGRELWSYDGQHVEMVADIRPGQYGSNVSGFAVYRDALYFSANNGEAGSELTQLGVTEATAVFRLSIAQRGRIAFTYFSEPNLGDDSFVPDTDEVELGFRTEWAPSGGQNPFVGVVETSTTATTPVFAHRSVHATTTFDPVDLTGWTDVEVSLAMQIRATEFESDDYLRIYVTDGMELIDLFDVQGATGQIDGLDELAGSGYLVYRADIPDEWDLGWLVISSSTNSSVGAERFDFDTVEFTGVAATSTPGDLNGDGQVNRADAAILAASFGLGVGADRSHGDLNGDGAVALEDLVMLQMHLAPTTTLSSSSAAVPEPSTLPMLLFGVFSAAAAVMLIRRNTTHCSD